MSNPSFSNIDLWLFELAEGNLSPEQVERLELFLLNHPELDVDRDVWEMARVDKHAIAYPNMAELERKRRPVAYFAFGALALLLLGSGAYFTFNTSSNELSNEELVAQNQQLKAELREQIKLVKQAKSFDRKTVYTANNDEEATANASFAKRNKRDRSSSTENQTTSNTLYSIAASGSQLQHLPAEMSDLNIFSEGANSVALVNRLELSPVNYATSLLATNQTDSEEAKVGNEEFQVQKPRPLDIYQGRDWNSNRSSNNGGRTMMSSNYQNSLKDRLSKFTRSIERMMNAPIALKNSRDPHYLVPGLTANDISFSSTGTMVSTRVQAMSRLQWQGKDNEQLMNQLSADGYSYGMRGGWGLQMNHQWYKDGGIQVAQAAFTYSPKISVNNWVSVEPSVRIKMGNKRLDMSQLSDAEQVELERGNNQLFYPNGTAPIGKSLWYKDLGLGLLINTKWFFAGVQADNLFKHKDNLYDNNWNDPRRAQNYFTATIGTDWISRNEELAFSPYAVYQKNDRLSELWVGANFSYNWFNIGLATSNNLEPAASIGMKFDHFSLHYTADLTESRMLDEKALSHQLTLRFVGKQSRFGKQFFKR